MIESSGVMLSEQELGCAEQLSRFFPGATPVCCAVEVTLLRAGSTQLRESTLLEFASPGVAIFLSALPLEFDDRVRLGHDRIGSPADAIVIAVQYHEGRKAVAVRFTPGPCEWVTQPR